MSCWCGGNTAGYAKHTRRVKKTEPCPESRAANATYQREYRAQHREEIREYRRTHVTGWCPGSAVDVDDDAL